MPSSMAPTKHITDADEEFDGLEDVVMTNDEVFEE